MAKKETTDFSLGITAKADFQTIDKDVMAKVKKLIKELKELGVEIQTAFISSGHIAGGSVDLVEDNKAEIDSSKK